MYVCMYVCMYVYTQTEAALIGGHDATYLPVSWRRLDFLSCCGKACCFRMFSWLMLTHPVLQEFGIWICRTAEKLAQVKLSYVSLFLESDGRRSLRPAPKLQTDSGA